MTCIRWLRAGMTALLLCALLAMTGCTDPNSIQNPPGDTARTNTEQPTAEDEAAKHEQELQEFYEHEYDREDPLAGKELEAYPTVELLGAFLEDPGQTEAATLLLQRLTTEPVDTADALAYADAPTGTVPYDALFRELTEQMCPALAQALEEMTAYYGQNTVRQPGFDGGILIAWNSGVDMRTDAAAFYNAVSTLLTAYAASDAFGKTGHLRVYTGNSDFPIYMVLPQADTAAVDTGSQPEALAEGTHTGINYLPPGEELSYELYKLSAGGFALVPNTYESAELAMIAQGNPTVERWFTAACEKLGWQRYITAAEIRDLTGITVLYEDGDVAEQTDREELGAFEALAAGAVQTELPVNRAYGFSLLLTREDGTELTLRTLLDAPTCFVTETGLCYDCGTDLFARFGMELLLSPQTEPTEAVG